MRSAVCKFKRHIQKSGVFLHTSNEHADTGIKSTISFATAQKKKKNYLGINLTRHVQDLYAENYTAWIKKKSKISINGETHHDHGLEDPAH